MMEPELINPWNAANKNIYVMMSDCGVKGVAKLSHNKASDMLDSLVSLNFTPSSHP